MRVNKSVYFRHKQYQDGRYGAPMVGVYGWGGSSLKRTERLAYATSSDYSEDLYTRHLQEKEDQFSEFEIIAQKNPRQNMLELENIWFAVCYDHLRSHDVRFDFQRLFVGTGPEALTASAQGVERYFDHGFYCISQDNGKTFSAPKLLKYEHGEDYDESDWGRAGYLTNNRMYGGYTAIMTRGGKLLYPFCLRTRINTESGEQATSAIRCMIGTWDDRAGDYAWDISSQIAVPLEWSGRGLLEPTLAELADGRIVMGIRGSTQVERLFCPEGKVVVTQPGRHWLAVSDDGGFNWGQVQDWRYTDDEQFYSPSTHSRLLRHSNGKLYWIGNICPDPPEGNMPRHPLVIAQVDENMPSLKKDTVTVIDTKGDHEEVAPQFQLSNFCVLENTHTGVLELYMTRYGESPEHWLKANAYKYEVAVRSQPS